MSQFNQQNKSQMVNILVLGDAHFMTSNVKQMNIYLEKLEQFLEQNKNRIDMIINMGDTLDSHSRLHVVPLNMPIRYTKLLCSFKQTYIIVGNHDYSSNNIFLSDSHWLNCLKSWPNLVVVDNVLRLTVQGHDIILCPYVSDGKFVDALNTIENWKASECIFSHVTIKGANMGSRIAEDADVWNSDYPMLISGHIHEPQHLAENMYYTGSILQVAVDEKPDKTIALITLDKTRKYPKIEKIDLRLPKKRQIKISLDEVKNFHHLEEENTSYTLYISGSKEDIKSFRLTSTYIQLKKKYRITFQQSKEEQKEQREKIAKLESNKLKHFHQLLQETIKEESNLYLTSLYKHVVEENSEDMSEMKGDTFYL